MSAMTGVEGLIVSEWVTQALVTDLTFTNLLGLGPGEPAANRVWEGVAPEGTPTPFVAFTVVEPTDVMGVGTVRVMTRATLLIRLVDAAESYGSVLALAKRMDAVLNGALNEATDSGGTVCSCIRQRAVQYPEIAQGIQYRHLGGTYEVIVQ